MKIKLQLPYANQLFKNIDLFTNDDLAFLTSVYKESLRIEGVIEILTSSNIVLFKSTDMHYFYNCESFIIRNFLKFIYQIKFEQSDLCLKGTNGSFLRIEKKMEEKYLRLIYNEVPLLYENEYSYVNKQMLSEFIFSEDQLYNASIICLKQLVAFYERLVPFYSNDDMFMRYFQYLENVVYNPTEIKLDDTW
jgi:hypothetical protein